MKYQPLTINNISDPISHIVNRFFITGIASDQMKIAKVFPLCITDDPSSINKYRPVSIIPHIYLKRL